MSRTLVISALASLLCMISAARSDDAPPLKRLTGADAERALALDKKIRELDLANNYEAAAEPCRELLELRSRLQGADHWEPVDVRWRLRSLERLAKMTAAEQTRFQDGR